MTDEYVRTKITEALAATDDNKHDAQKLLITWAVRDPMLLLGMAKPHLKAISAALVDHALRVSSGGDDSGPDKFSKNEIDDMIASANLSPTDKRRSSHLPPPKSTERQASTMRKLAAAFTRKKK